MKTSGVEVLCDFCHEAIPTMAPQAIFVTLRGPEFGHKKLDFCNGECFVDWVTKRGS